MKRQYEALIVLDTKGKEESVEQLVSTVSNRAFSLFPIVSKITCGGVPRSALNSR